MRLTATVDSANKRESTSFCSWSRSVRNSAISRWNASDSIASRASLKTRIFRWVENGETLRLTQNGKTIICTMDNSVLLVVSRLSSYSSSILSTTSRKTDQSNYSWKNGNNIRSSADSKWQACRQIMTSRPRRTVDQQTRWTRKIPVWLQSVKVNLEDLERHVLAHSSERANSDSEGDASKVEAQ